MSVPELRLPNTVTYVGERAFSSARTYVMYLGNNLTMADHAFTGSSS